MKWAGFAVNTDPGFTWWAETAGRGAALTRRDPSKTAAKEIMRMEYMGDVLF